MSYPQIGMVKANVRRHLYSQGWSSRADFILWR